MRQIKLPVVTAVCRTVGHATGTALPLCMPAPADAGRRWPAGRLDERFRPDEPEFPPGRHRLCCSGAGVSIDEGQSAPGRPDAGSAELPYN